MSKLFPLAVVVMIVLAVLVGFLTHAQVQQPPVPPPDRFLVLGAQLVKPGGFFYPSEVVLICDVETGLRFLLVSPPAERTAVSVTLLPERGLCR